MINTLTNSSSDDLAKFAFLVARNAGKPSAIRDDAATIFGDDSRITRIAKATILAGGTNDGSWAAALAPYRLAFTDWMPKLRDLSAFDAIAAVARRGQVATRAIVITSATQGHVAAQGAPKPLSQLSFDALSVAERKAVAIVVVSDELLRLTSSAMFDRELETAVAAATDAALVAELTSTAWPSAASVGSDANSVRRDLRAALDLIGPKAASKIFMLANGATVMALALLEAEGGEPAFPDLDVGGGLISGIRVIPVDAMPANLVALIDAARLVVDPGTVVFDGSREANLQMSDTPDSPATASTILVNLFQRNLTALRCERHFGFTLLDDAAAIIDGVAYGDMSE